MTELPDTLTLRDDAVVLRDWRIKDAPVLKSVAGDPDVCRFTSVPWTYTAGAAEAWVRRQHAHRAAGTGVVLAITAGEAAAPVGTVNLAGLTPAGSVPSLGYWLTPEARGLGLATRSAQLLCAWGFAELKLTSIELCILPEQARSQRVAERLGATYEGLRPGSDPHARHDADMLIYSMRS
jgi:RimJ/RimL family protein N-acetyltransferase